MRRCARVHHPATQAVLTATLLLAPLYALAGTLTPVKLRVHGREVALKTPAVYDGREVYLPLDALGAFRASYVVTRREETAIVTPSNGASLEIALARPGREPMIPLSMLNRQLRLPVEIRNGVCDLDAPAPQPAVTHAAITVPKPIAPPARRAAQDESVQVPVSLDSGQGNAAAAAPHPTDAGSRPKADRNESRPESKSAGSSPFTSAGARVASARGSDLKRSPNLQDGQPVEKGASDAAAPHRDHEEQEQGLLDEELRLNLPPHGSPEAVNPTAKPQYQSPPPSVKIEDVTFEGVDEKNARIRIKTSARAVISSRLLRQPTRLSVDFARSAIAADQREWMVDHPFVHAMHLVQGDDPSSCRLVLDLAHLVGYNVDEDANGVTVNLMIPRGAGKRMNGLRVVIDPGHGGPSQTGCSAVVAGARVYEKNLTLATAKWLQRLLTEAGVDVIMTRTSDAAVGLDDRPAMANRNNADLFVSIHIDDCGIPNSASGTTAYYHMDDASSRALAHSIAERIGRVSGLPVRGAWSDRRRFPNSGMAVLRGSRVPATLVEVGYINNSRDRAKLVSTEFQQTIAQAIFDGIKGYVHGDLPDGPAADADSL